MDRDIARKESLLRAKQLASWMIENSFATGHGDALAMTEETPQQLQTAGKESK